MSASFQLLDEPWIPVETRNGPREVGLLELFSNPENFKRVAYF